MHESLKPPTDCLYKFLAIFGVVVAALSWWGVVKSNSQLTDAYSEFVRCDSARFHSIDQLNTLMKMNERVLEKPVVPNAAEMLRELKSNMREFRDTDMSAAVAQTRYDLVVSEVQTVRTLAMCGAYWGYALAGFGFVLWFFRVQRHQDVILRASASKARAELTSPDEPAPAVPTSSAASSVAMIPVAPPASAA